MPNNNNKNDDVHGIECISVYSVGYTLTGSRIQNIADLIYINVYTCENPSIDLIYESPGHFELFFFSLRLIFTYMCSRQVQ